MSICIRILIKNLVLLKSDGLGICVIKGGARVQRRTPAIARAVGGLLACGGGEGHLLDCECSLRQRYCESPERGV